MDHRLEQIAASAQHIKFPAGAFGKTCMLVALIGFSCAAISWAAPNPYVSTLALFLVSGVAVYALRRAFNFADKNPSAAILEGAEFVRHEELRLAAKNVPQIPYAETTTTAPPDAPAITFDAESANAPDLPYTGGSIQ
jgi:hypothetical protein